MSEISHNLGTELKKIGLKQFIEQAGDDHRENEILVNNSQMVLGFAIQTILDKTHLGQSNLTLIECMELREITEQVIWQYHNEIRAHVSDTISPYLEVVHRWLQGYGIDAIRLPIDTDPLSKKYLVWEKSPEMQTWLQNLRMKEHHE